MGRRPVQPHLCSRPSSKDSTLHIMPHSLCVWLKILWSGTKLALSATAGKKLRQLQHAVKYNGAINLLIWELWNGPEDLEQSRAGPASAE